MSTLDSSMTSGDIITDHGPPFDCTDADLVLRSSDNVNFLVHKALLKFASSVIREFPFEITQEEDDLHDGKPVFPLIQEHSSTVDQFLRLIYPLPSRSWNSLAEIHAVLEMGRKYDVEQIPRRISDVLLHGVFMKEQPLGVYALACGYEMHAVAGRAARVMVTQSTPVHLIQEKESTVLSCMTGEELYELLQYYRAVNNPIKTVKPVRCLCQYQVEVVDWGQIETTRSRATPHSTSTTSHSFSYSAIFDLARLPVYQPNGGLALGTLNPHFLSRLLHSRLFTSGVFFDGSTQIGYNGHDSDTFSLFIR
ncbi:hypothetical protein PUNSTDRAFT_134629 [Punctularia strigosozonata HHB-11173 SS5]|uniref:uncharacterized protein n=1 Tax=Punctularia strigosozonata (strain HHB-11173) TaxID=741275 RepID=UPI000441732F|nr:uncharacterized protein PUNSTDRAFT_134629 [Punctularia strigosozonata HHB-11173 SS5]EIN08238.1 hypothetical protein PUNSTDRAFT_134629 [Punctularia strigosozonata HHB-11173 SS5]